jgi:Ca-activated chloride channel family protein
MNREPASAMAAGLPALALMLPLLWSAPAAAFDLFVSSNDDVTEGNERLAAGENAAALAAYDAAARALPGRPEVHLNRGLALARLGDDRLDGAMQAFEIAGESGAPVATRARALRNLGDAFFRKEDFQAAIDHYRKSLMLVPGNRDAAWNLEVARQRLKQQEEEKKEQEEEKKKQEEEQQKQQDQDQQDQQDQQQQDQQDQQQQDQQDQQQQDQQDQQQQDQQDQQQQQEEASPRAQQEMEQVLDSLDRNDDNLFKQQARQRAVRIPAGTVKDW